LNNPKDPPLDRKAELMKEVDKYAFAVARKDPKEGGRAHDEIIGWLKEVEDHAGRSAFNRASDHAAQMESVTKTLNAITDSLNAINGSGSNYRAVEADIRALLASALRITTRSKVSAEVVTNGGGA
jgi:hypothetical protein